MVTVMPLPTVMGKIFAPPSSKGRKGSLAPAMGCFYYAIFLPSVTHSSLMHTLARDSADMAQQLEAISYSTVVVDFFAPTPQAVGAPSRASLLALPASCLELRHSLMLSKLRLLLFVPRRNRRCGFTICRVTYFVCGGCRDLPCRQWTR